MPTTAPSLTEHLTRPLLAGDPDVAGPLAVFPLLGPPPRLRYVAFAQAAGAGVVVRELAGGASVNDLLVENPTDTPVLLYDGEQVLGAQQDRTFDRSVLVAARSKLRVPVSCVEAGRWDGERHGEAFSPAPEAADPTLRRAKARQARERAEAGGEVRADQSAVWEHVADTHRRFGVASPTGALKAVFEDRGAQLAELQAAIRPRPEQVGTLAAIGGRFVVLDHCSVPEAFAALHGPLVRGYALDALGARVAAAPSTDEAAAFLAAVCQAPLRQHDGLGMGRDARFTTRAATGTAVLHGTELIQLTAFAETHGTNGSTRIRRPSRRR